MVENHENYIHILSNIFPNEPTAYQNNKVTKMEYSPGLNHIIELLHLMTCLCTFLRNKYYMHFGN